MAPMQAEIRSYFATPLVIATLPDAAAPEGEHPSSAEVEQFQQVARTSVVRLDSRQPRVVLRFPDDPADILLSGALAGGEPLAGRALVVDLPLGEGHIVMFATRPFWRSQTHGSHFLAFNALLHWNDLRAGSEAGSERKPSAER